MVSREIKPIFIKERSQKFRLLVFSVISIFLIYADNVGRKNNYWYAVILRPAYISQQFYNIVYIPLNFMHFIMENLVNHKKVIYENRMLKIENILLQARLQKELSLELENSRLKRLLQTATNSREELIFARILHIDPDPFLHHVVLNKGEDNGVKLGQAIIDANGVMGSIISLDKTTSRVMLITDASSAIPIINARTYTRTIAVGVGKNNLLELQHLPNTADIMVGDMLLTSGIGGKFPAGYPVGTVAKVFKETGKPFLKVDVTPIASLERSNEVLLLKAHDE